LWPHWAKESKQPVADLDFELSVMSDADGCPLFCRQLVSTLKGVREETDAEFRARIAMELS